MTDTTDNAFLGGRLQLLQPKSGYRAGLDPVLLAAACDARPGARVLDLGCGVGTAMLCLGRRVSGLSLTGVDILEAHASLARENAARNGLSAEIVCADLRALPAPLRQRQFDWVIANPPFFDRGASTPARNASRETGRGEAAALADWVDVAARRLAPRGRAVFIQRAARLPDLLAACQTRLGSIEVIPLIPRPGRPAGLVLMRAQKDGRAEFRLNSPITLHRGATHDCDQESYTTEISAVLRDMAPLPNG